MEQKKCSKCNLFLDYNNFFNDSKKKDGYSSQCKKCKNISISILRQKRKERIIEYPIEKKCSRCNEIKTIDNFCKTKTNKDGLSFYCKECRRLNDKDNKNAKDTANNVQAIDMVKKCTKCNIDKLLSEFKQNAKSIDKLFHICTNCLPKNNWTKEKQRISEKKYRQNNPEKMKLKYKIQSQNINRRIRDSLNHRIKDALFAVKKRKTNNTIIYIGCDIDFFKEWIEHLFYDNMSWDNYGKWHFDHVKPCSSFDLSDENQIKECFNWKNQQPLWELENLIKSDKIDNEMIDNHKIKAEEFYKIYADKIILSAQVKEGELLE